MPEPLGIRTNTLPASDLVSDDVEDIVRQSNSLESVWEVLRDHHWHRRFVRHGEVRIVWEKREPGWDEEDEVRFESIRPEHFLWGTGQKHIEALFGLGALAEINEETKRLNPNATPQEPDKSFSYSELKLAEKQVCSNRFRLTWPELDPATWIGTLLVFVFAIWIVVWPVGRIFDFLRFHSSENLVTLNGVILDLSVEPYHRQLKSTQLNGFVEKLQVAISRNGQEQRYLVSGKKWMDLDRSVVLHRMQEKYPLGSKIILFARSSNEKQLGLSADDVRPTWSVLAVDIVMVLGAVALCVLPIGWMWGKG